jgi:hypothetical protein
VTAATTAPRTVRTRALGYLREGKVTVLRSATEQDGRRPYAVQATVRGHRDTYWVELMPSQGWVSSCGCETECPHRAAVQIVTGWPSLAAKAGA